MPIRLPKLRSIKESTRYYATGLYRMLDKPDSFVWAQAIAFKVLVTIVPLIILATGVLGQVLRREQPFEAVAAFVREFLPPFYGDQLIVFLDQLQRASGTLTIIGVAGLIVSGITLFTTLRIVITNIFAGDYHRPRGLVRSYLLDFRMVLQVGLLFLLSIGLSIGVQWLNTFGLGAFQQVGLTAVWIQEGWRSLFQVLGLVVPFLITALMFFQLIYFIPKPHPPRSSAAIGALVTSVLWEFAKYLFTFYATSIGRFERYQQQEGIGALGDTFVLIIAFVFWVYFSGLVLIVGASISMLHEMRHHTKQRSRRIDVQTPTLFDQPAGEASTPEVEVSTKNNA
jgi:membrane protein